jgi:hypothetical protein
MLKEMHLGTSLNTYSDIPCSFKTFVLLCKIIVNVALYKYKLLCFGALSYVFLTSSSIYSFATSPLLRHMDGTLFNRQFAECDYV